MQVTITVMTVPQLANMYRKAGVEARAESRAGAGARLKVIEIESDTAT